MTLIKNCFLSVIVMFLVDIAGCYACEQGEYPDNDGICINCPIGYACDGTNKTKCKASSKEYSVSEGGKICETCNDYVYVGVDGEGIGCDTSCLQDYFVYADLTGVYGCGSSCPSEFSEITLVIDSQERLACSKGNQNECPSGFLYAQRTQNNNTVNYCIQCPKGYACRGRTATTATQCNPADREYTNAVGQSECSSCESTKKVYVDIYGSGIDCKSGTCGNGYETNGETICKMCGAKKFSVDGAACSSCLTGYTTIGVEGCEDSASGLGCSKCMKMETKMCVSSSDCSFTWPEGLIIGKVNANNITKKRTKPNTYGFYGHGLFGIGF